MKTVLLIACICIASAAADPDPLIAVLVNAFEITETEAQQCIDKTNVVRADVIALEEKITKDLSEQLLQQNDTRRVICLMTCAAQAQGVMVGAKINTPQIHAFIEKKRALVPKYVLPTMHDSIDICAEDVKDVTDECEVSLKFMKCLINVDQHLKIETEPHINMHRPQNKM